MSAPVFVTAQRIHNILKTTTSQTTMTSAILSKLAEIYPEVITTPQIILGPNYLKVLDFWRHIDTLRDEEKRKIFDRCCDLDYNVRVSAIFAAWDAATEVVGEGFRSVAWWAALNVTEWGVFGDATSELIGDVDNKVAYDLIMSHKNS